MELSKQFDITNINETGTLSLNSTTEALETNGSLNESLRITDIVFFWVYTIISVFGIIGCCITVSFICCTKRLHTATYLAIAGLCFADMNILFWELIRVYLYAYSDVFDSLVLKSVFLAILMTVTHASASHLIFLSALRYTITKYTLRSYRCCSAKNVILSFALIWILSATLATLYTYGWYSFESYGDLSSSSCLQLGMRIYFVIVPFSLIIVFHYMKMRGLKNSIAAKVSRTAQRVSKVAGVIVIVYLSTQCPIFILYVCKFVISGDWFMYALPISQAFVSLNYAADPYIYFYFSPAFRLKLRNLLKKSSADARRTSNISLWSSETQSSKRKVSVCNPTSNSSQNRSNLSLGENEITQSCNSLQPLETQADNPSSENSTVVMLSQITGVIY